MTDATDHLHYYLRDFRQKLAARLDQLHHLVIGSAATQGEKTRANKAIDVIKKQLLELEDYERDTLYPLATEQIALDPEGKTLEFKRDLSSYPESGGRVRGRVKHC